jgi:ankyrin repeat protein
MDAAHYAAMYGHLKIVKEIVPRVAEQNSRDYVGMASSNLAKLRMHFEVTHKLLT